MEITLAIAIIGCVLSVCTFAIGRKDKAIQNAKENHQELIEYQLKELKENNKDMSNDIKDIKKMLNSYKDEFRNIIKEEMEAHIQQYHKKGE